MNDRPERVDWVSDRDWRTVVENVPVPSVDLIVRCADGVLLARRRNRPARGQWFVPGGRVRKGERLTEAVHRVADEELGVDVTVDRELGAYDHFYSDADVPNAGGKHYVAHGYVVVPEHESFEFDNQHDDWRVFGPDQLPTLHPYVRAYLVDAGVIPDDE